MKAKKAIKKIAALGMGATMLGATLLGASAAGLGNYPNMFMEDNQFNGLLVVGEEADAVDTIGMANVAMGLQAASVSETTVSSGDSSTSVSMDEGVKIEESSNDFNLADYISDVRSTLDDDDLPNILADGNYNENEGENKNDEDFTQRIDFKEDEGGQLVFTQDDDDAPEAAPYIKFAKNSEAYTYTLEFDSPVKFDTDDIADDLESTTIDIQGQTYTITDVKDDGGYIDEITMLVGDTMQWLTQDDVVTKTIDGVDHEVKMINVDEDATSCGLEVDGSTIWIDVDNTEEINGISLGVTDAKAVHTKDYNADICKVNFGAQELVLEQDQEVEKEGKEVDGSNVNFAVSGSLAKGDWEGFKISFDMEDDVYLSEDDEMVDPVFENFKYVFGGVPLDGETVEYSMSSDDGVISFMNQDGDEVELELFHDASDNVILADGSTDVDDRIYFNNGAADANNQCKPIDTEADDIEYCEGARWLLNAGGEAHLVELSSVDIEDKEIEIEDLTTDKTVTLSGVTLTGDTTTDGQYVSGLGDIEISVGNDGGDGNDDPASWISLNMDDPARIQGGDGIETENGLVLSTFEVVDSDLQTGWTEESDDLDSDDYGEWATGIYYDVDDEELLIDTPDFNAVNGFAASEVDKDEDDDDTQLYVSKTGTVVEWDSDDKQDLTLTYPEDDAKADVFVGPTSSMVETGGGEDGVVTEEVQKIGSQVTKFDTEVSDATSQDLISIGGPCANSVTSALMGNPEDCSEGFESGMALLKLVENGDNTALVVAGGTGKDTRVASTVLQDYEEYSEELSGSELKLTTVSESNIGFESVE